MNGGLPINLEALNWKVYSQIHSQFGDENQVALFSNQQTTFEI
jgi:hypothetical protein